MEKYLAQSGERARQRMAVASALREGNWNSSVIMPDITADAYLTKPEMDMGEDYSSENGKAIGGMVNNYLHPQQVREPGMTTVGSTSLPTGRGTGAAYNVTAGDSSWLSRLFGGQ